MSLWIRPEKNGAILSKIDEANNYRGVDMWLKETGVLSIHMIHKWPTNAIKITTRATIENDRWSHLAVVYDGSRKAAGLQVLIDTELAEVEVTTTT